ncbi:MAG: MFS transporter [Romboutsia sp.]
MKSEIRIKKYIIFTVLTMATGVIYKLPYIQDVFYVPIQESLNLNHSQIGNMLSVAGFISVFGFLGSIYFIDKISKKIVIPISLIGVGITGLYLYTLPGYFSLIIIWIVFALFSDMFYWPVVVKTVKDLGEKNEQGRIFGFFEAGRGLFDTIVVLSVLYLFSKTNSIRDVILFYSISCILIGIVIYFILEKEYITYTNKKNKLRFPIEVIKSKEVLLVSGNIFCSYAIYCGITYMMPFLQNIYDVSLVSIGIYSMLNQYGLKMIAGPLGGYLADRKFKSASKYFRFSFMGIILVVIVMILLPEEGNTSNIGFLFVVVFSLIVSSMKALLFAPMEEIKIREEISGQAISLASFIGYSPLIFCYSLYGNILDKFSGLLGYRILFCILIGFGIMGLVINKKLINYIDLNQRKD